MTRSLVATYRLQFRDGMDFARAASIAPYLGELGVSHLYASPVFEAASGSTHGYDVTDHGRLDAGLGGRAGFDRMCAALDRAGLGLILDIVPNHMAASPENPWWRDVLEWGSASPRAGTFDIDWSAPRIVLPVLGEPYGKALEAGELRLAFDSEANRFSLAYFDLRLPLAPPTYAQVLDATGGRLARLAADFAESTPETVAVARSRLRARLDDTGREDLEAALDRLSARPDFVHALHERQHWRAAYWRYGREGLTYRRFFEIISLIGVRVEDPAVFAAVHRLALELVEAGAVDGLRVDHVDGLADPRAYLERLASEVGGRARIFVEKILEGDEELRRDWPVAGTTGYEFIAALAGLLTDPAGEAAFDQGYGEFLAGGGPETDPAAVKRQIVTDNLAGELAGLTKQAAALAAQDPATRDYGPDTVRRTIVALLSSFPVYRTYVDANGAGAEDRAVIEEAVGRARRVARPEDTAALDMVAGYLAGDVAAARLPAVRDFATRFQQTSGPVMAKAVEDTLFYRATRLIGLNEVGGDPDAFAAPVAAFHARMAARVERQPEGLSATATHDTKRGEDARARLYALSERPRDWAGIVARLSARARRFRTGLADGPAPEPAVEWMIYQAIFAGWPATLSSKDRAGLAEFGRRVGAAIEKALREAKERTSWTSPNEAYEAAVLGFTSRLLDPVEGIVDEMAGLFTPLFTAGALNGLVQTLLKVAAPGVPDIYQGCEAWDFSFVDPDNRRPVDFAGLADGARGLMDEPLEALLRDWRSGRVKQRLLMAGLAARAGRPELFTGGAYRPIAAAGERAGNVVAFCRSAGSHHALAVAPIRAGAAVAADRPTIDPGFWGDTSISLPADLASLPLREALTGRAGSLAGQERVATILGDAPVALYVTGEE